jgi:hypothetical protein
VGDTMKYHTRSGSVYEVDEDKRLIRRTGDQNPYRSKYVEDWTAYEYIETVPTRAWMGGVNQEITILGIKLPDKEHRILTSQIIKVEGVN